MRIFAITLVAGILCLQQVSFSQALLNKVYDINFRSDAAGELLISADNHFLLGGVTNNSSLLSFAAQLTKINSVGDTLWTRQWEFSQSTGNDIRSLLETSHGNYLAFGRSQDSTGQFPDLFLMELDTSGSIIWRKEYPIAGVQSAQDMKATPDGGYLLTGWTWDGCSTCWEDGFLLKTDSLGNQQWYERYGGTHSDYFNTLTLSPDGGYVMGGTTYNANNSGRPWLLKTDSLGNQLWSRTYGNTQSIGFGVAPTTDGGYLLAGGVDDGTSDYDACLIKTNAHGMQQWRTCIPVPFLSEDFAFPLEQPDGTYIAVGNFSNPNQQFKPQSHMVAFSQTGDTLWRRTYEHYQNKDAYVYDIKPLPGGGVGMVGAVLNNDLPQKNDMWLVTTDACGYTSTNSPQVQAGFNISSSGSLLFLFQNQTLNGCRYTWDFGDGNTSQQQNPEHQYAVAGNYTLTLIACAGINCDTLTQTITVAGAAEELGKEEQPKIIPNPNSGEFWLTYALQPDEGKLCIYNVVGRLVHQEPILQWSQVKRVNLKHLPEGVYHSRLVWKGKTGVVRFVKW